MRAARGRLGGDAVMVPDRFRSRRVVGGQIPGPLSGRGHTETAGPRPIHHFADQRRLVAVGHGIDHPRGSRFPGQHHAGQHVGLHVDHHHVLPLPNGASGVGESGQRVSGGLHHDFNVTGGGQFQAIADDACAVHQVAVPAHGQTGPAGPVRVQIRDDGNHEPPGRRHLGKEHGPEFAGADEAHAHRPLTFQPPLEQLVQVHVRRLAVPPGPNPDGVAVYGDPVSV